LYANARNLEYDSHSDSDQLYFREDQASEGETSEGDSSDQYSGEESQAPDYNWSEVVPNYDIWEDIKLLSAEARRLIPSENVYDGCPYTVDQFSEDLLLFLHQNVTNATGERDLMTLLNKYFPKQSGYNLPLRINRKGFVESNLNRYKQFSNESLSYDICKSAGCSVYAGDHYNLTSCRVCETPRYNNCTHPSCKSLEPFDESLCSHRDNSQYRTSLKYMTYRPLYMIFSHLLSTPGFLPALRYSSEGYKDGLMRDLTDSPVCKKHLQEMHNKYLASGKNNCEEVNILLSKFYDGAQIYRWKKSDFYPCVIGILNLPPSYRGKLGVGLFLSTLFTSHKDSTAENFIFKSCLVEELKKFCDGIEICVAGKTYFVQARLILHICDTIELQSILRCMGANSCTGCPLCNIGKGLYKGDLHKTVYLNGRLDLPALHFLRFVGNIPYCCPSHYYTRSDTDADVRDHFYDYDQRNDRNNCCNSKSEASYYNIVRGRAYETEKIWYHKKFPFRTTFDGSLRYPFCDFRDQVEWERHPNDFYIRNGILAEQSGEAVEGIYGPWHYHQLLYANVATQIFFDPMHIFKNWLSNLLDLLMGKRCQSSQLQAYLKKCNTNDWHTDSYPWMLSVEDMERIDCMIECICVPKGYVKNLDVKRIFSEKRNIKASGYISIATVLMPFIMTGAQSLSKAYKSFFLMLSEDFIDLLAVEIDPNELDELFNRIKELLGIKNGLFPDSEAVMIFHQILDLRASLENFGPLRNTWAMAGERSINRIKHFCSSATQQNNLVKYTSYEVMKLQQTYNFSLENLNNQPRFQKSINDPDKVYVDQTGTLVYDDSMISIFKREIEQIELKPYESNNLALAVIQEVFERAGKDEDIAHRNSPLFRIYKVYLEEEIERKYKTIFFDFLKKLNSRLHSRNDITGLSSKIIELLQGKFFNEPNLEHFEDLERCLTFLPVYRKALIYGLRFKSRGLDYAEEARPTLVERRYGSSQTYGVYLPSNEHNDIKSNWNHTITKNTWAKLRIPFDLGYLKAAVLKTSRPRLSESFRYAQNNYFFDLQMKTFGENFIENVLFSNVTARYVKEGKVSCKVIEENSLQLKMYDAKNTFVPLSNYFSTAVAYCAFGQSNDKNYKPYWSKTFWDSKFCQGKEKYFCEIENQPEYLYMIDIHPERRCIHRNRLK
jgi:hypothetical protein